MTTTLAPHTDRSHHLLTRLAAGAVVAVAVDALVALVASRYDDGGIGMGLNAVAYVPLTLIGVLVAAAGWGFVEHRWPTALPIVVPVALVLSWIPDVALVDFGATLANVVGLMAMHVVVAACVVAACRDRR